MAALPEEIRRRKQVEEAYFASLNNLAALYRFKPLNVSDKVYPYNIYLSHRHAAADVKRQSRDIHLIIMQDSGRKACLATAKAYDTGATLYYLPVKPVFDLLRQGKRKEANLLLSVFAYLLQVAGIPHYLHDNGFLENTYMMIEEWLTQDPGDWEPEAYAAFLSEIRMAEYGGRKILRQMRHRYHLQQFEQRVQKFAPLNDRQLGLWECAKRFLQLYRQYPAQRFYANIHERFLSPEAEERITPEQYLSFIWSIDGALGDELMQQVNYSLQELSVIDEPLAFQYFDAPQESVCHDLPFETTLFALLDELAYILERIV